MLHPEQIRLSAELGFGEIHLGMLRHKPANHIIEWLQYAKRILFNVKYRFSNAKTAFEESA